MTRALLAFLCVLAFGSGARAADIKLLTTGAFNPVALDIVADFEKQTGHKVNVVNDTAGGVAHRISSGEPFDLVVLTQDRLDKMVGDGKIVEDTITPLIQVGIGVAVRLSAPRPDISNIETFRRTLLSARAVAYMDPSAGATSGIYLEQMFQRLGILPQIRQKAVKVVGGLSAERVARGEADIALQQYSEILLVPGVQHVGLIPAPVQNYTIYAGAVGAHARDKNAATDLLAAFADPGIEPILKKHGVDMPQ
ncbi:MAG TPA: substrate-binding domain-containing protein [Reyranella sp.]|jgi:molybdate transport system substrate-binding protein|nr:substrate-binding domain-containing protein [Reyranella sp.]